MIATRVEGRPKKERQAPSGLVRATPYVYADARQALSPRPNRERLP